MYTLGSFRCNIALLMYSSLSSTTIVEPLSALLITMCGLFIKSLSVNLFFLVRLSYLFCLYWSVFSISSLTLCKKMSRSRVPLLDNLLGLKVRLRLVFRGL